MSPDTVPYIASDLPSPRANAMAAPEFLATSLSSDSVEVRALIADTRRAEFLRKLSDGEFAPIILLTGAAGAGKTTVMRMICESREAAILTRYLPRQKRNDDVSSDREWSSADERRGAFFAHDMYKGAYAFPAKHFSLAMKELRPEQALLIQIARGHEVASLVEACQQIYPMAPVVPLRIDAPISVISSRLNVRTSTESGEVEERLAAIGKLKRNDEAEEPYLEKLYGQRTILSLTAGDIVRFTSDIPDTAQRALDRSSLGEMVNQSIANARSHSKALADDVLKIRTVDYGDRFVPDGLIDVLENDLIPATLGLGPVGAFVPALKGGTAMRFYAENTGRAVSPDIDFTMIHSATMARHAEDALFKLLGAHIPMVNRWDKTQWPAFGAHAEARSRRTGEVIELDALLTSRVRPLGKGFCYEFPYDAHDNFMRRTVALPNGSHAYLVPPEHTLLEKLAAGRGADQKKFDLYDSAGIITQVPLNPSLLHKVISLQRFDPQIDQTIVPLLMTDKPIALDDLFEPLGIESQMFRDIAREISEEYSAASIGAPQERRVLTATALKQIAFLDRATRMLDKMRLDADMPVDIGGEIVTAADRFGRTKLQSGIAWLQTFFEHFGRFETGRSDVFVRRGAATDQRLESAFFGGLEEQIVRLQRLRQNA